MATCTTAGCVNAAYAKIAKPEVVARIVYYSNLLRLRPGDRVASHHLLSNIPVNDEEYTRLSALGELLYPDETTREIDAVGQAYWHMSRNLARSLKLYPGFLPAFIRYGLIAANSPAEDDYPNWAARVCRSNPGRFLKAFETLSPKDRHYIAKHIIQPKGCKQIAFPEAGQ